MATPTPTPPLGRIRGRSGQRRDAQGDLVLGRCRVAGADHSPYTGKISDVTVHANPTDPWSGRSGPVVSGAQGSKCLDDYQGGTGLTNPIVIWDRNGTLAQKWALSPRG
ncbi:hypothetical protein [Streptomyces sp. NPDC056169]|uniref:hypothetical protein n=1 Tax=Streptomyces sp. NPDC056169 TaxID=3345734 RepID=UPI0035E134AE